MAVCLITGGAGFIGSHLADALVARGDTVRVLDDFSSGTRANLAQSRHVIDVIVGDVNDPDTLDQAVRGAEYIFHLVGMACERPANMEITPGKSAFASHTLNLLTAARHHKVSRVIYISSGCVYGNSQASELKESDAIMPVSPCGFAKQAAENQCAGFTLLYGLETVRLRLFHVFGPRQSATTAYAAAIPLILRAMLNGDGPVIKESPFAQHDYLYISDAVHAILLAASAPRVAGKVYNIARGRSASLVQVVNWTNQILSSNLQPLFADTRLPDEPVRSVSIARAEAELGFCPTNDLKQGLTRFIDHLKTQQIELATTPAAEAALV
jgi:UDP-glucose 4-epimerase